MNKRNFSGRRVRAVMGKELIDYVRDWRTLLAVILIPVMIFPLLFIALPLILQSEYEERMALDLSIIAEGEEIPSELNVFLVEQRLNISFEEIPDGIANLSDPGPDQDRVKSHQVQAILRLSINSEEDTTVWNYSILRDSTDERANEATRRIVEALSTWESSLVNSTLQAEGLDPELTLDPVRWGGDSSSADVATKGEQAGFLLSMFIPMIVATWTATSAMQPAIDMTAGERERGTLEALLCAPIGRFELLLGKWLAVATIAAVGVLLQVVGLLAAISFISSNSSAFEMPSLSTGAVFLMFFCICLFAVMVVAFQLALAVRSHSVKEAGSTLGPIIILIIFPAMFAQFINLEGIESWWFLIPVVNILLALRELLTDTIILEHTLVWIGSSLLYAILAAWYASNQFHREDLVESIS